MRTRSHLTTDAIMDLLEGVIPEARTRLMREHAASCDMCRAKLAAVESLLRESDNDSLAPSGAAYRRIRAAYLRQASASLPSRLRAWTILHRPLAIASASAAVLVVALTATFTLGFFDNVNQVPMHISYIEGDVYINNTAADITSKIRLNSRIRVGKNSLVELSHNKAFLITVLDDSVLVFEKSKTPGARGQHVYTIKLIKGTILSQVKKSKPNLVYNYATPEAHLKPLESEFILQNTGDRTVVIMKSGSTRIKSLKSDEKVTTVPHKKYTITESIDRDEIDDDELDEFDIADDILRSQLDRHALPDRSDTRGSF